MSAELLASCNSLDGLLSTAAAAAAAGTSLSVISDWLTPCDDVAGTAADDTLLPLSADWTELTAGGLVGLVS